MRDVLYQKSVKLSKIFVMNIVGGIAWAFGVTLGFVILATIVSGILTYLGGLPLVGNWFADLFFMIQTSIDKKLL